MYRTILRLVAESTRPRKSCTTRRRITVPVGGISPITKCSMHSERKL